MSNSLEQYRSNLRVVKPLLKTKKLKLDVLKNYFEQKNSDYEEYKKIYDKKYLLKDELLLKIESIARSGNSIDVNTISNARHYLGEVNEDLIEVSSSLRSKQQAADKASKNLTECHVDMKLMQEYEKNKKTEMNEEIEKLEARELEDMWLQNNSARLIKRKETND